MTRQRPLLATDLDDVLFGFTSHFFEWHNRRYGTDLSLEALARARYLFEAWGGTREEAVERMRAFFDEVDVLGLEPLEGAVDCLGALGHRYDLAVVSAKDPAYEAVTLEWVERYFSGVFDQVILGIGHSERGEGAVTKVEVCRDLGAAVIIDDQLGHLAGAATFGIRPWLFGNYPWNRGEELPDSVRRAANWRELCSALSSRHHS